MWMPTVIVGDSYADSLGRTGRFLATHFNVIGAFQNSRVLLDTWSTLNPEIVVLEISMLPFSGLETARELTNLGCRALLVFLTSHDGIEFVREALSIGASAYVLKPYAVSDLIPALRAVLAGKRFLSPALSETP